MKRTGVATYIIGCEAILVGCSGHLPLHVLHYIVPTSLLVNINSGSESFFFNFLVALERTAVMTKIGYLALQWLKDLRPAAPTNTVPILDSSVLHHLAGVG